MRLAERSEANVVTLCSPRAELLLGDGARASVEGGALELRDREGRLLVRYADGAAEIAAPAGDLVLSAPNGRLVMRSGSDVEVEAARDVLHRAARSVEIGAGGAEAQVRIEPSRTRLVSERLDADVGEARVVAGAITTAARTVATTAEYLALTAEKYELSASRLVERTKNAFRECADYAHTRVGRARTVVSSIFTLHTRRTVMASHEETSIDGRKILLG